MSDYSESSAEENPDILDLFDDSENEKSFSGFSQVDENNNMSKNPDKVVINDGQVGDDAGPSTSSAAAKASKGPGKGPGLNKKGKAKAVKRKSCDSEKPGSSKPKYSNYDPAVLNELLDYFNTIDFDNLKKRSSDNVTSVNEQTSTSTAAPFDLNRESQALFETENANETFAVNDNQQNETELEDDFPKIFADEIEFSEPIKESQAAYIVKCCTKQADIPSFVKDKDFKVPSNCKSLLPARLGPEIYNDLPPATRAGDAALQEVQKIMGLGVTPLVSLLQLISSNRFDVKTAKSMIINSLTLICNAHFELSIRRRYLIKRFLRRRFHQLCSPTNPVGETLFGSELTQKLKEIGESSKIMDTKGSNRGHPKNSKRGPPRSGPKRGGYQDRGDRGRGGKPPRRGRGNYSKY